MKERANWNSELEQMLTEWRQRHRLREDDAVLLLVELFRIHQHHWDQLRRAELPSFDQFRADIAALTETTRALQNQAVTLLDALRKLPERESSAGVSRLTAFLAALAAAIAGFLLGRGGQ